MTKNDLAGSLECCSFLHLNIANQGRDETMAKYVMVNYILKGLILARYGSVSAFCRAHNFYPTKIGLLLDIRQTRPWNKNGRYVKVCYELEKVLGRLCEDIFPAWLYDYTPPQKGEEVLMANVDFPFAIEGTTPLDMMVARGTARAVESVLKTLTPREEKVLRSLFGIGCPALDVSEVAADIDCDFDRTIKIRNKALRKLGHPSRSARIRDWL